MPSLGPVRAIPPLNELDDEFKESYEYASPGGEWLLRFSEPWEFAMGGFLWEVALLRNGTEVTRLPAGDASEQLTPWSADGTTFAYASLALPERASELVLGGIDGREIVVLRRDEYLARTQWAPVRNHLLLTGENGVWIVDAEGSQVAAVPVPSPELESPMTGWLPSGTHFFVLARASDKRPTEIAFYSDGGGDAGRLKLDPADLVPYDHEPFARLRRSYWSLECGPGTAAVGSLLDRWHDYRYEQSSGDLQLGVYRPISRPFEIEVDWGKEWACRVEDRWVAVELRE